VHWEGTLNRQRPTHKQSSTGKLYPVTCVPQIYSLPPYSNTWEAIGKPNPKMSAPVQTVIMQPMQTDPIRTTCPYCLKQVITKTEYQNGIFTYLCCAGLAVLGCFFGCCLIPFCLDPCKDVVHYCPSCGQRIGSYRRI
ncbi:Lipopolysaccharide-induced tumor necrosis factor-alpha factor, partial [Fasciolopsis buskii]